MSKTSKDNFTSIENMNKILLSLGLFYLCSLIIIRVAIIFSYVPEITGVDNNFVFTVLRMLAGFAPYSNPEQFPYLGNIYSPLFFDVCNLVGRLFNVNPEIPIQVFRLCRSVSLFCDITTLYVLYKILTKHLSLKKDVSVFILSLFFTTLCYLAYTYSRVDSLFLTLYTITIYLIVSKKPPTSLNILIIAFVIVCCIFSKQNGIILPVLTASILLASSDSLKWKRTIIFFVSFLLLLILTYFVYTELIGYDFLIDFAFKGVQNRIDPEWFYTYIFKPLANSLLIVPLLTGTLISIYFLFFSAIRREKGLASAYLIQLFFSLGASLKWGSSLGYFNESFLLSCIIIPIYIRRFKNIDFIKHSFWLFVSISSIFFLHTVLQNYLFFIHKQNEKRIYYEQQKDVAEYLKYKLSGDHVLDMCNQNRDFFKTFLYKEMAAPHFDTIDCCLLPDGNFDYSELKAELQNGKIKFIIFPKDNITEKIWGVSISAYKKDTTIYNYDIYKFIN